MPYDIHIVPAHEFIRLDAKGQLDLRATRTLLYDIAARCHAKQVDRILLDVRHVIPNLQIIELHELAMTFDDYQFEPCDRLAILHRPNSTGGAALFADTAAKRGYQIRAFDDFERAFNWLIEA
jgi:hypothetical protein